MLTKLRCCLYLVTLITAISVYYGEDCMAILAENLSSILTDRELSDESIENESELSKSDYEDVMKHLSHGDKIFYSYSVDPSDEDQYFLSQIVFSTSYGKSVEKRIREKLTDDLNIGDVDYIFSEIQLLQNSMNEERWNDMPLEFKRNLEALHRKLWKLLLNVYIISEEDATHDKIPVLWNQSLENEKRSNASQVAAVEKFYLDKIPFLKHSLVQCVDSSESLPVLSNASFYIAFYFTDEIEHMYDRIEALKLRPDTLHNTCMLAVLNRTLEHLRDTKKMSNDELRAKQVSLEKIDYYYQLENDHDKLRFLSGGFAPSHELLERYMKK